MYQMVHCRSVSATAEITEPRDRLLAAAVDHILEHGLSDLSLRELAAAIGTSHRMLIYHFGSKEGLIVAVIQTVEEAQRTAFAELETESLSPADTMRAMWRRFTDPSLGPQERLFFEIYGQALQGRPAPSVCSTGSSTTGSSRPRSTRSRGGASPEIAPCRSQAQRRRDPRSAARLAGDRRPPTASTPRSSASSRSPLSIASLRVVTGVTLEPRDRMKSS